LWAAAGISICWLLEPPAHVTFGLAALLLGAAHLGPDGSAHVAVASKLRPAVAVTLCAVAALLSGRAIISDLTVKAAEQSGDLADARRALAWNPFDGPVVSTLSTAVFDPTDFSEAMADLVLDWSERAARYEPGLPLMWVELGIRQLLFDDVPGARVSLLRAIELQPYHPLALAVLRTVAERQNDDDLRALVSDRLAEIDAAGDREGAGDSISEVVG
jgi:hypothetical protein